MEAMNQAKQAVVGYGPATDRGLMQGAQMGECAAARQTAKSRMRQQARNLRREADQLEALANALPEVLPEAADSALWELLSRR